MKSERDASPGLHSSCELSTGTTWRGTAGSFSLLRAVAGHMLAEKRGPPCYNHKAMNSAHGLSLGDDPECQVKTTVLVNTLGSVLWIPEQSPDTLCWDFRSTQTEIINGCKIGGNLLCNSRKQVHTIPSNSPCWGSERLSNMAKPPVPKWNSKDCKAGLPDFECPASFPLSTHAEKYRGNSMARGCGGQYWSLASSLSASWPLWAALPLIMSTPHNEHPLQHPSIWLQGEQWSLLVYQLILSSRNT